MTFYLILTPLKKVETWGKRSKRAILRGRSCFLNRKGEKIDRDNTELEYFQPVDEQQRLVHQDIIAEIPGVETTTMYNNDIFPILSDEKGKPLSYAERTTKARINTGLDAGKQARGVIRKQDEVITIKDDDDDVVPGMFVKGDSIDAFSLSGGENFPEQEIVYQGKNAEISNKGGVTRLRYKEYQAREKCSPRR